MGRLPRRVSHHALAPRPAARPGRHPRWRYLLRRCRALRAGAPPAREGDAYAEAVLGYDRRCATGDHMTRTDSPDLAGLMWRKSTLSSGQGECVETAVL